MFLLSQIIHKTPIALKTPPLKGKTSKVIREEICLQVID